MKRQRGRSRSSGKPQHNANRAFDSNGPEGIKVRGAAQSVYEKYQQLARDAQTSGDRVLAENYLQHAEHYFRLLRTIQPQRPLAEIIGRDQFASGYDLDFEEEPGSTQGEAEGGEAVGDGDAGVDRKPSEIRTGDARLNEARSGDDRRRDDRQRDDRRRDDRPSGERSRDDRDFDERSRDDRGRDDRSAPDRPREDRYRDDRSRESRASDDRSRTERPRDDRYRDERDRYRDDRVREQRTAAPPHRGDRARSDRDASPEAVDRPQSSDPLAVVEPRGGSFTPSPSAQRTGSILRADDGEVSHAPAFLNLRSPAPVEEQAPSETSGAEGETSHDATLVSPSRRRRVGPVASVVHES